MGSQVSYIIGRPSEFSEFHDSIPRHLEAGGFMLCTSGTAQIFINSKLYEIKKWDMLVAFPYSYAQATYVSTDFDGIIWGADLEFIINTDIADKGHYITSISANPCVSLTPEQAAKVLELHRSFLHESENCGHPFHQEILEAKLKITLYEIAALFANAVPNAESEISRDKEILNHFLIALYGDMDHHRELNYYAHALSITPSHLSKVVKRTTSRSASEWISDYTIICIKRLLQNHELQIATIAEQLHFPSASFMTQYFKQRTSLTPKQFRTQQSKP